MCPGEFLSKVLIGIRYNPIFTTFENKNDVVVTSIVLPIKRLNFKLSNCVLDIWLGCYTLFTCIPQNDKQQQRYPDHIVIDRNCNAPLPDKYTILKIISKLRKFYNRILQFRWRKEVILIWVYRTSLSFNVTFNRKWTTKYSYNYEKAVPFM